MREFPLILEILKMIIKKSVNRNVGQFTLLFSVSWIVVLVGTLYFQKAFHLSNRIDLSP